MKKLFFGLAVACLAALVVFWDSWQFVVYWDIRQTNFVIIWALIQTGFSFSLIAVFGKRAILFAVGIALLNVLLFSLARGAIELPRLFEMFGKKDLWGFILWIGFLLALIAAIFFPALIVIKGLARGEKSTEPPALEGEK